jgi:hypothetical protein
MPEVLGVRELGGAGAPRGGGRGGRRPEDVAVVSGGVEDDGAGGAEGLARWRRRAAIGVVVALFLAVAWVLTLGRTGSGGGTGSGHAAATASAPVEAAATAALDGWAGFASSGDLDQLRATFDTAGPQWARLSAEAASVRSRPAAEPPYVFSATLSGVTAGRGSDEQVVAADVVASRPGEEAQTFSWDIVMRRSGGRWLLWTVRDRGAGR